MGIILGDDSTINRLLAASRKRIQESQDNEIAQRICNAIGERRIRDVQDILWKIENQIDWESAVTFLIRASSMKYSVPLDGDNPTRRLEPLKFREVIFSIFDCAGFEPVNRSIVNLLQYLSEANSFVRAKTCFIKEISRAVEEHIESNDTLFFEPSLLPYEIGLQREQRLRVEELQQDSVSSIICHTIGNSINITPLWHSEFGRRALVELCIKGLVVSPEVFQVVISVLQVSNEVRSRLLQGGITKTNNSYDQKPLNSQYRLLLDALITCDVENLRNLGSRHACPVFNHLLRNHTDNYRQTSSSHDYRSFLSLLRDHIIIRWVDSISSISQLVQLPDMRIKSDAIRAIGNFYDEASAHTLLDIFCHTNNRSIRSLILDVISRLIPRCPETQRAVSELLSSNCFYVNELYRFYRKMWKNKTY